MESLEKGSGRRGILSTAGLILELTKAKITAAVTLSVATGYFLFIEHFSASVFLPALAVFLLACGSAALNQVQEAQIDGRMERTRGRPIPSGRIRREWALFMAMALMGAGFSLLSYIETHTLTLLVLAGLAVFWYNGVYFLLKRVTAFAVVPGALVGAIPPVIGWVSAGGLFSDPAIITVAFFFFLWQIPHFWLLLLIFDRDYEKAGLPTLTRILEKRQLARITAMWIFSVAVTGLLMAAMGNFHLPWNLILLCATVWLGLKAFSFLMPAEKAPYYPAFIRINLYAFSMMICLIGNACW